MTFTHLCYVTKLKKMTKHEITNKIINKGIMSQTPLRHSILLTDIIWEYSNIVFFNNC